ncbi:MAG: selenocysteine-specific translation elongation factor [Myxococcota bacterium]
MPSPPRPSLVLGTAGHIDHGKTALVRALTGQDTDRLPEEKARGITIELGFAWLDLDPEAEPNAVPLRIAVVDVPGHERFVRTMVAGASGIDLVLLVVAADEGVMPQTREHLAICALLGLTRGLVVLSKCDLVDAEMRALAEDEVREALRGGPLAEAPIVAASATTGEGIPDVRATLARLVATRPSRAPDARPARLWVDRVFEKHGFGTIVTGTWSGRGREVGQVVAVEPGDRRARIRGLERHGEAILAGEAGARIAVNLQGLATSALHRGDLVCEPDALRPTVAFDTELDWLARETFLDEPIPVLLLTGTGEREARVAPIGEGLAPGERGFARIHVDGEPLPLLPDDRFVLRGFARDAGVGATVGGGRVLDVDPPRRRRRDPGLARDLERLAHGTPEEGLLVRIERAGLAGTTTSQLARETGREREALGRDLAALDARQRIVALGGARWLADAAVARLEATLRDALDAFHAKEPLQPGMPRATLAGRLPENVPGEVASALIARAAEAGWLVVEEQHVRRDDFRSSLAADQEPLAQALLERLRASGLEAPSLRSLADDLAVPLTRLRALAHHLERQGELVAAPEELFFARADVEALIARVLARFADTPELDTQTFKGLIGTSRRTAMPLMALLDELQITRRDGSVRRLLQREPRWAPGRSPAPTD